MITDYEKILGIGQPWPPDDGDTRERLALYERNENLFEGCHEKVWQDELRKLRGDKKGDLRLKLNYFQLISLFWSDMACGETPDARADEKQSAQAEALSRIIQWTDLWSVIDDAVIDMSMYGDAPIKIRYQDYGIIENVPAGYWFPVVEASNVKQLKAHVIAYEFDDPEQAEKGISVQQMIPANKASQLTDAQIEAIESGNAISSGKTSYLKVEIHTVGRIAHRLYRLKNKKIQAQIELSEFPDFKALQSIEETGLDDFAIIVLHNTTSTKKYHGKEDYSIFLDVIKELEVRYPQVFFVLDKHSDPSMYGPPMEEQDPRDGEYKVQGGSRYITLTDKDQAIPGMLTWDGNLEANFQAIAGEGWGLMQRFYELSETSKVCFDSSAGGQGVSAQALRLMMWKPLKKANKIQRRLTPVVQQLLRLVSMLEVHMGYKGAIVVENVTINWHDGMPKDDAADAQRDQMLVTGGVRSAQGLMRDKGIPEEQIKQETEEMNGPAVPTPEGPKIELPGLNVGENQ
ncbi:phage portal protein [Candidatus Pacearchaeota archaeon]|jgi:hypothetical protein|nr:phage portal protein [Candidatus Pacearchaeota archaeon]